jgi:hypothetical protein
VCRSLVVIARVEAIVEVNGKRLGIAFECDPTDEPKWMAMSKSAGWSLEHGVKTIGGRNVGAA